MEVTLAAARRQLGVETQRPWSDLAILRTTPALLGLFSLVTLLAHPTMQVAPLARRAAWRREPLPTFSDALATVRRDRWACQANISMSRSDTDMAKLPRVLVHRLADALCYAA